MGFAMVRRWGAVLAVMALTAAAAVSQDLPDDELLTMWVAEGGIDPDVEADVDAYATRYHPGAYAKAKQNEFELQPFLDSMAAEIRAAGERDWRDFYYESVIRVSYDEYDTAEGGFSVALGPRTSIRVPFKYQFKSVNVYFPQPRELSFVAMDEADAQAMRARHGARRELFVFVEWSPKAVAPNRTRIVANAFSAALYEDRALSREVARVDFDIES